MTTTPTTNNPDRLAYDAMQEAIAYIQKQLGITTGDFAGAYFSDDRRETPILEIFADYARHEMRNVAAEAQAV
jgi:hypothetical protein